MNHELAFLQAIRETPHDDAPRLIYADWLEEQGGAARAARADFIRIQCRLDELSDDDPARDRLEDEAVELLAEHETVWTQQLHSIAEDWRFSRGFIEHIRIRGENLLTHAERLFDFAPLRSLHLLIPRDDVPHLSACPQLRWAQTLDFTRCQLNDRSLQQLLASSHLERLVELNLNGNGINTPGLRALVQSPLLARLHCLDLGGNFGIGDTAVRLLAQLDLPINLETLSLAGTNITPNVLDELFQSSSLPHLMDLNAACIRPGPLPSQGPLKLPSQLRSLDLSGARSRAAWHTLHDPLPSNLRSLSLRNIGAATEVAERLANSPSLSNLTRLDLAQNNLKPETMQALAASPHLCSLTHLNVGYNNIRNQGAKAIAESPYLTRLMVLSLESNGIGGPGLKSLAASDNLGRLRSLVIAGNFIGAASTKALVESVHLRNLSYLDLSDSSLEEDSARVLVSSANVARLTTLLLRKNRLGDGGAKALAQSPHLTRLATLDLSDNRIGKAGAEALAAASWRRMRYLDLRDNVFTDTEESLLRNRFGNAVQL